MADPSPAPPPGGASQKLDEIEAMADLPAAAEVSPRQGRALNKEVKAMQKKPSKLIRKPSKPMKAMTSLKKKPAAASEWVSFLKREHSKDYYQELTLNRILMLSEAEAKQLAGAKGRAKTAQLRRDLREGKLADFPASGSI